MSLHDLFARCTRPAFAALLNQCSGLRQFCALARSRSEYRELREAIGRDATNLRSVCAFVQAGQVESPATEYDLLLALALLAARDASVGRATLIDQARNYRGAWWSRSLVEAMEREVVRFTADALGTGQVLCASGNTALLPNALKPGPRLSLAAAAAVLASAFVLRTSPLPGVPSKVSDTGGNAPAEALRWSN